MVVFEDVVPLPLPALVVFVEVVVPPPPVALVVVVLLLVLEEPVPLVQVGTTLGPVGASLIASSALIQPVFAVNAAGHATCWKDTDGLSAF